MQHENGKIIFNIEELFFLFCLHRNDLNEKRINKLINIIKKVNVSVLFSFLMSVCFGQNEIYRFSNTIENDSSIGYQVKSWELSRKGSYSNALTVWDKGRRGSNYELSKEDSLNFLNYTPVNAVEFILSKADSFQVIMINEAHHNSLHRNFTKKLLIGLYKKGFRYFGLEALNQVDTLINERKYPLVSSGYYTKESEFGNLLREALKVGYHLFGYECSPKASGNGKQREIEQAENVMKILERDKSAKILIHAGFDHIREDENFGTWEKAMAGRFKEFTGIDPLTIDQVLMSERSLVEFENSFYKLAAVKEPTVFINEDGEAFIDKNIKKKFDLQVFHQKTKYIHSRPDWLFKSNKHSYNLSLEQTNLILPCLVFAYNKQEFNNEKVDDLIPVDIVEIHQSNITDCSLILEAGYYFLIFKDINSRTFMKEIEIK